MFQIKHQLLLLLMSTVKEGLEKLAAGRKRFSPQVRNFLCWMSQRAFLFFLKGGVHISVFRLRDGRAQGAEN